MIKLKNVSKFYYSKGIIASGITKVNLELNVGEFVVITGESGSGKSTLLNVISGLDSYEEGEMYINGQETSHYSASDFEEYRKQYIASIFQTFNLIGSYTVFQNVALALQIDGKSKEEINEKVPAIIEKVGMTEYAKTKVSKLSGGQKQRVAIARALAKDTQILVADEPTGNLDSESARGIVELLTSIAKDKLVIVVTHNYEQFQNHATRIIKMYDGKIVEDSKPELTAVMPEEMEGEILPPDSAYSNEKDIRAGDQLRLGVRNTFNLLPKFLLMLLVFVFVVSAVSSQYVTLKKQKDTAAEWGYNPYFENYSKTRIVVKKADNSEITDADYANLAAIDKVVRVVKDDMVFDGESYIESDKVNFYGYPVNVSEIDGVEYGRLPTADNEVVLGGYEDLYPFGDDPEAVIGTEIALESYMGYSEKMTIVGVFFLDPPEDDSYFNSGYIYLTDGAMSAIREYTFAYKGTVTAVIDHNTYSFNEGDVYDKLVPNTNAERGRMIVPEEWNGRFSSGYANGGTVAIHVSTIYYAQDLSLTIQSTYNKNNYNTRTGLTGFDDHNGEIYVNPEDYRTLFNRNNYQATVFADTTRDIDAITAALTDAGFSVLVIKDHIYNWGDTKIMNILMGPLSVLLVVVVFFVAYFVIRLILKSRGTYFAILRMLGMAKNKMKHIMDIEIILECLIAYAIFITFILLNYFGVIQIPQLMDFILYLKLRDYFILGAVLVVMAFLISSRFTRGIFRRSAMGSFREEA